MTEDLMCSSWVGNHNSAPPSSTVTSSGSWEPISSWVTVETKLRSPANKDQWNFPVTGRYSCLTKEKYPF